MPPSKLIRSLEDGTAWVVPGEALSDLQWRLRYADEATVLVERLAAAEVVSCYEHLLGMSQRDRNKRVAQIRSAGRVVSARETFERVVGPATPETPGSAK